MKKIYKKHHYTMKLYLASYTTGKSFLPSLDCNPNYLETYLVFKNKNMQEEYSWSKKKFFLDSGAFSAFTLGKHIDLYEYIKFCQANKEYLEVYANLDDIESYKKTEENQKIMEQH